MTRLLILGDSAGTGFGTVTADLGRALIARGEDIRFMSLNEQQTLNPPEPFANRMIAVGRRDGWLGAVSDAEYARFTGLLASGTPIAEEDRSTIEGYVDAYRTMQSLFTGNGDSTGWKPDAILVIGDAGSLDRSRMLNFVTGAIPTYHYVPIEGTQLAPRWAGYWQRMTPIAMTEFGAGEIEAITGQRPRFFYHGVDTHSFWPVSELRPIRVSVGPGKFLTLTSKRACKEFLAHATAQLTGGLHKPDPAKLWIGRADRNMPRKMYGSLFRVLGTVLSRFPDVEFLYHCRTLDEGGNLDDLRSKWPTAIAARMMPTGFHDEAGRAGANRDALNAIYNAFDIYVSSGAEGFGLTVAEAMACGVPVVGLDFSAVSEVIGDAGLLVPVGGLVDCPYGHWWARPDEPAFVEAVVSLIQSRGRRRDLGAKGTDRVRKLFRWDTGADTLMDIIAARPLEVAA